MILVDNSQLFFSSFFAHNREPSLNLNEELVRHTLISEYADINKRFKKKYGELVLCQDAGNYWRTDVYSGYKKGRKELKKTDTGVDWQKLYDLFHNIKKEIAQNLPYQNIQVAKCEADDIIFVACKHAPTTEKILVVSSDKDMMQLYRYKNVDIYNPRNSAITPRPSDVEAMLMEHIIRGDASDSIPNILTPTKDYLSGIRQKPITKKRLLDFQINGGMDKKNLERNQQLIDMSYIPIEYEDRIVEEMEKEFTPDRSKIFNYFVENKMKLLMDSVHNI